MRWLLGCATAGAARATPSSDPRVSWWLGGLVEIDLEQLDEDEYRYGYRDADSDDEPIEIDLDQAA